MDEESTGGDGCALGEGNGGASDNVSRLNVCGGASEGCGDDGGRLSGFALLTTRRKLGGGRSLEASVV